MREEVHISSTACGVEMVDFGDTSVDIEQLEKEIAEKTTNERSGGDLSGELSSIRKAYSEPHFDQDFDTLDEPILVTFKRDLSTIGLKFCHVFFPTTHNRTLLRDWDLWGPLFICVFISLLLQSSEGTKGPHFTEVFIMTFFGSCIVTINVKLLGGSISFFQSLCVLGYCLLTPAVSALFCQLLTFASEQSTMLFLIRLVITVVGFVWATYASMAFLIGSHPPNRKALIVYPIFLFYFVISWLIISHSKP